MLTSPISACCPAYACLPALPPPPARIPASARAAAPLHLPRPLRTPASAAAAALGAGHAVVWCVQEENIDMVATCTLDLDMTVCDPVQHHEICAVDDGNPHPSDSEAPAAPTGLHAE